MTNPLDGISRLLTLSPMLEEELDDRSIKALEALDAGELDFIFFVLDCYPLTDKVIKLNAEFPLIYVCLDGLRGLCSQMKDLDPKFPERVLGEDKADLARLYHQLYLCYAKSHPDPSQFTDLLKKISFEIAKTAKTYPKYEGATELISKMIELFSLRRPDLFNRTLLSYSSPIQLSRSEYLRIAVKSCQILLRYYSAFASAITGCLSRVNDRYLTDSLVQANLFNHAHLRKDETLTLSQKNDISFFYRSFCQSLLGEFQPFFNGITGYLLEDMMNNYHPVIQSPEVDHITCGLGRQPTQEEFENYNKKYVQEHCSVYENYIPRVIELQDWFSKSSELLEKNSLLLKFFSLYLKLGDLSKLRQRLDANHTIGGVKTILIEEIESFAAQSKRDPQLRIAVTKTLLENKFLLNLYNDLTTWNTMYSEMHLLVHTTLDLPIEIAQKLSPHLFYIESETQTCTVSQSQTISTSSTFETVESESDESSIPEVIKQVEAPPQVVPIVLEKRLESLKIGLNDCLKALMKNCLGFGTKEALGNVQVHWQSLLCVLKRALEQKEGLSDTELCSFVLDLVREGGLAVEQALSALDRSSNRIKGRDALKKCLTHDLVHILMHCKFNDSSFSHRFRKWIAQMNLSEILSRNLNECSINGTHVEKLLVKVRLLSEGSTAYSRDDIVSHALEYFKRVGLVCIELQKQINGVTHKDAKIETAPLRKEFLGFCREIQALFPAGLPAEQFPALTSLPGVTQPIAAFRDAVQSLGIKSSLNNVLHNLCFQLQSEMAIHEFLEPVNAYHHMSKVLLLNQIIAEKYLLNLCDALSIAYDYGDVEHHLVSVVQLLGMGQKNFTTEEWDFLSSGKAKRLLTRYPLSYKVVYQGSDPSLEKTFQNALSFSQTEIFEPTNQTALGFVSSNKQMPKQMKEIRAVVEKDLRLLTNILNKVSKAKLPELS